MIIKLKQDDNNVNNSADVSTSGFQMKKTTA